MSTTIDSRVVEMRFDNKHFESNVSTTMSTLDKLKQKLNLDGASKGLENINSAAGKVDMSTLSKGIENVGSKFSAMEVVAITALANITNSAVNAGKKLVKSLSVDQIASGWNKYGQKTSSVQTIMNATGKSIDEVNQYLNKLMWFSDETSYGFTDMTAALGQMTSAGGNIDKLVPLITGVANATAFAGKGAAEFSRVMYNLNQSYGAGYLQYMDWRSIDLAGVSSKQLKQTFIDVGVELGKIKEGAEEGQVNLANFATTLKDKWADTEVMEAAFGRFAEMSEKAYEMVQSGEVDTASEAYEILSKKYDGVAITAAKAAQEAKTFGEALDATKDAVSSGWMKTFEIVFGDYEKAKVLWTDLANTLWDVFAAGAEVRNWVLETALNFAKPWQAIEEKLGNVTKAIEKVKSATDTLTHFQEVVSKVWRGDFNNQGDNPDRRDLLKAAGYDPRVVQDLVNKGAQYKLTVEDIEASHKKFGIAMATDTEETEDLTVALDNLTDKQLKEAGLTEDEIDLYRALQKEAKKTGKSVSELADEMSKNDGRTMLIDSFKNFGSIILDTIQMIKDAFKEVFNPPGAAEMVVKLYNMIKALKDFSEKIRFTNKETGELTETGQKFMSIFKGIFAAIDIVITIIKGPVKIAFKVLKELLGFFGVNVVDILAGVGEALVSFRKKVDHVVEVITTFIVDNVGKWIEKFKETKIFKTIAGWFEEAGDKMSDAVDKISGKLDGFNTSGLATGLTKVYNFISGIAKTLSQNKIVITVIDGIRTAFEKLKGFFSKFKMPKFSLDGVQKFLSNFITLGDNIKGSGKTGIAGVLGGIGTTLNTKLITPKWTKFQSNLEGFFTDFVSFWTKVGSKVKDAFKVCKDIGKAIVEFLFGTNEINLPVIMAAVEKFLWIALLFKSIQALDTLVSPLENISLALNNFASSLKWDAISSAFKSLALALGVFTICVVILAGLDSDKAWEATKMLGGLMIVMGVIIGLLGFLASKMGGLDVKGMVGISASLFLMVAAIALLVKSIKDIDELQLKDPVKTFGYLALMLVGLTAGIRMIGKASGTSAFKAVAAILTLLAALKLILEVIDAYDQHNFVGQGRAIFKMVEMIALLSLSMRLMAGGLKGDSNFKGLAMALLAMVLSLKILLGVIDDIAEMTDDELKRGLKVIAALMGIMTIFIAVSNLTAKTTILEKGQKGINSFSGFAFALLAVCAAIWILGKTPTEILEKGAKAVAQVLVLFTGMLAVVGKSCSGLKTGPIIAMLVAYAVLLAEMAIIIKKLDGVSWESKISSAGALAALILAMAYALQSLTKYDVYSGNIYNWVGAMALLAIIMGGLAFVLYNMKDLGGLNTIANATALSVLLGVMALSLLTLIKYDVYSGNIYKWVGAMAVLSLVVGVLGAVLWGMSALGTTDSLANATALSELISVLAGVLFILSKLKITGDIMPAIGALGVLALVVLELGIILSLIKPMNISGMESEILSLSALLTALTGVMAVCAVMGRFVGSNMSGFWMAATGIAALGAVVLELGVILHAISGMQIGDVESELKSICTLLIVLTGVVAACSLLAQLFQNPWAMLGLLVVIAGVGTLGLVIWELGAILKSIKGMDIGGMIPEVKLLSALLIVLTAVLAALAAVGLIYNPVGVTLAIGGIALLGLVIWELGAILSKLKNLGIGTMIPEVAVLSVLLIALTAVLAALTALGLIYNPVGVTAAIAGLGLLGLVVLELGYFLSLIKQWNIGSMMPDVIVLSTLLLALTTVMAVLTVLGTVAIAALAGIAAFEIMIVSLGALLIAIGKIMSDPTMVEFLDTGLAMLQKLAVGLGSFASSLNPFFTNIGQIDDSVVSKVETLSKAILMLSVAELIDGSTKLIGASLPQLGKELSDFATNASGFFEAIGDIDPDAATAAGTLVSALMELTKVDFVNSLTNLIFPSNLFGEGGLGSFGKDIEGFAGGMKAASEAFKDFTDDDVANIKRAATAGEALADLNRAMPGSGGLWQKIAGEKDLAAWGEKINAFADCLVNFSLKVSGENAIDKDAIIAASEAGGSIAELNNGIPKEGGAWQKFAGSKDIAAWGEKIVAFAGSLVSYSSIITGQPIDVEAILNSAKGASALAEVANALPKEDGFWQKAFGQVNIESFGTGLSALGNGIVDYATLTATIDDTKIESITNSGDAIDAIVAVVKKIPKTGGTAGWFGEHDPYAFGTGVAALASAIGSYCEVAATVDEADITAINFTQNAVDALEAIVTSIAADLDYSLVGTVNEAANQLSGFCATINAITLACYDYSGLTSVKSAVTSLATMFVDISLVDLYQDCSDLNIAADYVKQAADRLVILNDKSYGGIAILKNALDELKTADIDGVLATFEGKAGSMEAAVTSMVDAITNGLSGASSATNVTNAMLTLIDAGIDAVGKKNDAATTAGTKLASAVSDGLNSESAHESARSAGVGIGISAFCGVISIYISMYNAGGYLVQGFAAGITDNTWIAEAKAKAMANAAEKAAREALDINSPSKVFKDIGSGIPEGFAMGIGMLGSDVKRSVLDMTDTALLTTSKSIARIADLVSSDIDSQPTIRPVLDLSDVESGVSAIGSMFGTGSIGVRANLGAISSMMSTRSQNGGNADVVSELAKLRKDIGNMSHTTNNINGVTYDDGSNINNAVATIVRAARIERRV